MAKQVILFLTFLAVTKSLSPRDLADEALAQCDNLQNIVQGEILAAHDDINNQMTEYGTEGTNKEQGGHISIDQEFEAITSQINTIKDLANSIGIDVSSCTTVRESVLNRMPDQYKDQISGCIGNNSQEANRIARDTIYTIDIIINKVNQLRFQVTQCNGNLLCISPLLTEISLDEVRLPQNVRTEVLALTTLLNLLGVSQQSCSDDNVAEYTSQSYSIVGDMTACVNRILG